MPDQFLHGVEVVTLDGGPRPIRTVRSSVIGVVGTAPKADAAKFPVNTPVLIAGSLKEAAGLGTTGTLHAAVDGIFDQVGAMVVVIRVEVGADKAKTLANVIGGVDDKTGKHRGVHALLAAKSVVNVTPRVLIAPGFSHQQAVVAEMMAIADRLRAVIIADGPSTTDAAAIAYRKNFGSSRVYLVDPAALVFDTTTSTQTVQPISPRVAGVIARVDNDLGFWNSPSNKEIYGLVGVERAIDFALGDANSRANLLNEKDVATVIRENGFRLWGNRTCSSDPKWAFLSVQRTADILDESLQRAHLWAVDRKITKHYLEDVAEGVKAYLCDLKALGAILDGDCWPDPNLNTPSNLKKGKVYFNFDFTPPYPAEHITFRSDLTDKYFKELV